MFKKLAFILKIVFFVGLSVVCFYYFDAPFLVESAFAEEVTSNFDKDASNSKSSPPESSKPIDKSYSATLWEYRWYFLAGTLLITTSVLFLIYFSSGETPPPPPSPPVPQHIPIIMPPVPGQTITDLLALRPDVHMDVAACANMPDILLPDSQFFAPRHEIVTDPNFIKGFNVGTDIYQVYMMPAGGYDSVTAEFWINHALKTMGSPVLPQDMMLMHTKVAVIPVDSINYTVYHKVDIVKLIPDPGHPPIPNVRATILFKDNEINWA